MTAAEMRKRTADLGLSKAQLKEGRKRLGVFTRFCSKTLGIKVEPFERLILLPYFAGVPETLILIPKGNGKTTILAALAVFHMTHHDGPPEGYIGAGTGKQAKKMYVEAARMAKKVNLLISPGYQDIRRVKDETEGFFRVLSSDKLDAGSIEGIGPTLSLMDELHAHANDALYAANHGALHKQDGSLLGISTAGANPKSMLARLRARALGLPKVRRRNSLTIAAAPDFVMFEFSCDPTADLDDIDVVKAANPASFVTKRHLRKLKASPSMTESRWARYHCNVWRDTDHSWLQAGAWSKCGRAKIEWPAADEPIWVGVNFRPRGGSGAAITYLWESPSGKPVAATEIFDPPSTSGAVAHQTIKETLREAAEVWQLVAIAFDDHQFHSAAVELENEGLSMRPIKMTPNVWVPITTDLMEAINSEGLLHGPDDAFAKHVNAGELRDTTAGQMIHGMVPQRVEALIALGMAWWARDSYEIDSSDWDRRAKEGYALL